jgi:UDP-N-acetylglucosamine diphosphorylase / glucose-1-phosphate thymidylyltransferase / UDP-N-acetylgalactosamine diphosphorylase / glucosamine-1-phosphate N-acetyltransferase / galactosamine-1-phosphate N-acetyltransferase
MLTLADLIDLSALPPSWASLADVTQPWEVLDRLDALLAELEPEVAGEVHPSAVLEGPVRLEAGARIGPHAYVRGPVWLMPGAEIGHGAHARGGVLLGAGARLGHASEAKRAVLLADAKAPHFNYVGDSLVGQRVNLGAGVKLANFKALGDRVRALGVDTGLRKLGALVGDDVSIGCNAVLAPGTVVGPRSVIYQNASVRGTVPPDTLVKLREATVRVPRRAS